MAEWGPGMVNDASSGVLAWLMGHTEAWTPSFFHWPSRSFRASVSPSPFTRDNNSYHLLSTYCELGALQKTCLLFMATLKGTYYNAFL